MRLAEIIAGFMCNDNTNYKRGSVVNFLQILFKLIYRQTNKTVKLADHPMIKSSIKILFYLAVGVCMHYRFWNNSRFDGSINLIFSEWIEQILNNFFMQFF